jgi:hypothetical protein
MPGGRGPAAWRLARWGYRGCRDYRRNRSSRTALGSPSRLWRDGDRALGDPRRGGRLGGDPELDIRARRRRRLNGRSSAQRWPAWVAGGCSARVRPRAPVRTAGPRLRLSRQRSAPGCAPALARAIRTSRRVRRFSPVAVRAWLLAGAAAGCRPAGVGRARRDRRRRYGCARGPSRGRAPGLR